MSEAPIHLTQLSDEALAIIQRRRHDLKGKSLEEIRAILKKEHEARSKDHPA